MEATVQWQLGQTHGSGTEGDADQPGQVRGRP